MAGHLAPGVTCVQVSLVSRDQELCGLQSSVTACEVTRGHTTTSVMTTATELFDALWEGYAAITPSAPRIHDLLRARGLYAEMWARQQADGEGLDEAAE